MAEQFVPFECPSCGPRVETFPNAEVTCACSRRCRPPEWVRAQFDRARKREARARTPDRSAGQSVAVFRDRRVRASVSEGRVSAASGSGGAA
jgi:hypothetical protein